MEGRPDRLKKPPTTDGPIAIRLVRPTDARMIAQLHIRSWQQAYRGQLPDSFLLELDNTLARRITHWAALLDDSSQRGHRVLVAEHDGSLIGFVTFGPADGQPTDLKLGEVQAIYLDSAYWGRGYGRALFHAATEGLRDAGFNEAVLWVLETNKRARRFYESAGWKADGRTKAEKRGQVVLNDVRYGICLVD